LLNQKKTKKLNRLDREQQAGPQYADGMFLLSSLDTNVSFSN